MASENSVKRKICLIGDGGVGKTSLIRRFVLDQFDDKYKATFGTKITKKDLEIKKGKDNIIDLSLLIWDIMGQEAFKKAQSYAYEGAQGAFIVCDITDQKSLVNVSYWYKDLIKKTKKIPVIILANKNDLKDEAKVKDIDLDKLSKKLNAPYFFTSAKTGENVEAAFHKMGNRLVK